MNSLEEYEIDEHRMFVYIWDVYNEISYEPEFSERPAFINNAGKYPLTGYFNFNHINPLQLAII